MHQRQRRLLVKTEERVHFRRQRECVPVAGENAKTVVTIHCPVSPVQGLKGVSGVVGRSKGIAAVKEVISQFGQLDILVNNAAVHYPKEKLEEIDAEQLEKTFQTNFFSIVYLTRAALPH